MKENNLLKDYKFSRTLLNLILSTELVPDLFYYLGIYDQELILA